MYFGLEAATLELEKRWHNEKLRQRMTEFLAELPATLHVAPRAMIARSMASPNYEQLHFISLAGAVSLKPLVLEYSSDKMCSRNQDKSALCKLTFDHGLSPKGHFVQHGLRVANPAMYENQPMDQIVTTSGERLPELHHRLMKVAQPGIEWEDQSLWLQQHGGRPCGYYPYFLGMFICHGILFENFLNKAGEQEFTAGIVKPTIAKLERDFGVSPLIVELLPNGQEKDKLWNRYPGWLQEHV